MLDSPRNQTSVIDTTNRSEDGGPRLRPTDWWVEGELRRLGAELDRTRQELETLRTSTALMLTAILGSHAAPASPVAEVAPEIRGLAELGQHAAQPLPQDGVTAELEMMDETNQESLAHLDRRFRWSRPRRRAAEVAADLSLDGEPQAEADQDQAGRPV